MFKKIFTNEQLSFFFQVALLTNLISLFFDMIVYHYFSDNQFLKLLVTNLDHVSSFVICLTIVSQALFIFSQRHEQFLTKYKIAAVTLEACIGVFFIWLLSVENDLQTKTIIFSSSLSKFDHNYKLILILIAMFIMLSLEFYRTIKTPAEINDGSISELLRSTTKVVLKKHLAIFICIFGMVQFKTLRKFAHALWHNSEASFIFDFSFLEWIIPVIWIVGIGYYIYQRRHPDTTAK